MGDIDFFKHVNDTYGHDAGDEVLRTLSRMFCTVIGEKGEVCRWGGEEFLFVFPGMDMDEVQLLMSDLLDDIRHTPVLYERKLIHVTMTFGVEEFGRIIPWNLSSRKPTASFISAKRVGGTG